MDDDGVVTRKGGDRSCPKMTLLDLRGIHIF